MSHRVSRCHRIPASPARQGGAALLMVLMAMALVSATLTGLTLQGQRELTRLQLEHQETQAHFYARGAEIIARRGLTDAAVRHADLWWQTLAGRPLVYPTDEGELRLVVRDLRRCFNINALVGDNATLARRQLLYWLAQYAGERPAPLTPDAFVARLTDWVDADSIAYEGSMDGVDYARQQPPRLSADSFMVDESELNWLAPLDRNRYTRFPELCVLPDDGPWRLNLNSLSPDDLPLLDALFVGRVDRGELATLLRARPPGGYQSLDEIRHTLGGTSEWLNEFGNRLRLTPDYLELDIRITLDSRHYYFHRRLLAEGTSAFSARQPAARVVVLSRRSGYPAGRLSAMPDEQTADRDTLTANTFATESF